MMNKKELNMDELDMVCGAGEIDEIRDTVYSYGKKALKILSPGLFKTIFGDED